MAGRSPYVETIRGFAILLVVAGHVIGDSVSGGMKAADDSFWRYLYFNIDKLQMPLFTIISGWVYAIRPLTEMGNFRQFVSQKAQRLLIPMLAVVFVYYLIKAVMPGEASDPLNRIWTLLIVPYNVYWFLPSLFWLFVISALLDIFKCMDKFVHLMILLIISAFLYRYQSMIIPDSIPNYFSFKGAIYLLPFFLIGIGMQRFKSLFSNKYVTTVLLCSFVVCMILVQLVWFQVIGNGYSEHGRNSWLGICTGLASVALFYNNRVKLSSFVWIGSFSYSIYLFHSIIKGISQSVLTKIGIHSDWIIFVCGFAAGVLLSILADKILSRWKITGYVFLGKPIKRG